MEAIQHLPWPERFAILTLGISVETGLRYALFAGVGWWLGGVVSRSRWWHRKIVPAAPRSSDVRREIIYSARTAVIFGVVGALTLLASRAGWTRMYFSLTGHSWGWFWGSVGLAILVHDTWFYWTHRLLHHPRVFRHAHRGHHLSTNPSAWAAYAFDPLEAVLQASIFPLVTILFPIHPLAFGLFMVWQLFFNVLGHTGYEFWPRRLLASRLGRWLNTPTNHVMHHEYGRGNYALYFSFWDRWMGTHHERYEARFVEVTSRDPVSRPELAMGK